MGTLSTLRVSDLLALIVDEGRRGYEHLGVPVGGPMHVDLYRDACYLTGTTYDSSAIEMFQGIWEFNVDIPVWISVTGEGAYVQVDGREVGSGNSIHVPAYAFVKIARVQGTHRGPIYVSISGFSPPLTLGSASADTFGGLGNPPLAEGAKFDVKEVDGLNYGTLRFLEGGYRRRHSILMERGPWEPLVGELRLTVQSISRSGIRFESYSEPIVEANSGSIASFPVFPGAIQVPPSNAPIVLGPDAGTTGGYPVIGVVSADGLATLSEALPGDVINFTYVENVRNKTIQAARHQID